MVYTVLYKTSSFAGYCFLDKNSIHPKGYGVFSFKAFKAVLVKIQICSFIDYNLFGVMCAGTKKTKRMKQDYSRMDIVIGNKPQGNLQNMTVAEYQRMIKRIFQYLNEEYGIAVNLQNLKFSEMEINCTFGLEEEFYKYHRVLRLLMFNLPKSYKKLGQISGINKKEQRIEPETFYRGNSSTEVKIYDKKKHLEQTIQFRLEENIMRIEFILKKSQKIKEVLNQRWYPI